MLVEAPNPSLLYPSSRCLLPAGEQRRRLPAVANVLQSPAGRTGALDLCDVRGLPADPGGGLDLTKIAAHAVAGALPIGLMAQQRTRFTKPAACAVTAPADAERRRAASMAAAGQFPASLLAAHALPDMVLMANLHMQRADGLARRTGTNQLLLLQLLLLSLLIETRGKDVRTDRTNHQ